MQIVRAENAFGLHRVQNLNATLITSRRNMCYTTADGLDRFLLLDLALIPL